jgi:hypothetical protein
MAALKIVPAINTLTIPTDCGKGLHIPYTLEDVGVTQSLMGKFQSCRRSWLLAINRWELPSAGKYMGYGSMVHEVLDKMYSSVSSGDIRVEELPELITAAIDAYDMGKSWSAEDAEMQKAKAQAILECYIIVFKKDFVELRFEAVEEQFDIKWNGVRLRGKVDGKFRDKNGGGWNMEHKNYSKIVEDTLSLVLTYDLQNLFYMLADKVTHGKLLKGVLYNILRNPEVRKMDGGPAEVYKMLKDKVMKDPRHYFIRFELPYGKPDMSQFEEELEYKILDMKGIINGNKNEQFSRCYKNERVCTSPYTCEYIGACASKSLFGYRQQPSLFNELPV